MGALLTSFCSMCFGLGGEGALSETLSGSVVRAFESWPLCCRGSLLLALGGCEVSFG